MKAKKELNLGLALLPIVAMLMLLVICNGSQSKSLVLAISAIFGSD
ncbi:MULTISPECIES: hypothetical protein [Symbiopectobacterium]|nr:MULTISPECIES: hypothetical protein [Symbiopectobacterium]MBT9429904.1 hypothetical protein [Candidatus Symbiopectobacterium endolongispinus]